MAGVLAAGAVATSSVSAVDAATVGVRISYDTTGLTVLDGDDNDLTNQVNNSIDFNLAQSQDAPLFSALGFTALEVDGARCTVCPNTLTMDLEASFVDAPELLEVLVSGIDFLGSPPGFRFTYAGIHIGSETSILTEAYVDSNNTMFGTETLVGSFLSEVPSGFFGQQFGGSATEPYSQTLRMVFDFTGQETTMQGQSQLTPIPVPASLPLLLGGIGLLGLLRLRRQR